MLEEVMGLYQYLYQNGQEHRGLPHLHKEHLCHRPLFKSKHKRGFFRRRRIVPLYLTKSQKVRQAQASRFGRQSGQEAEEVDSDENMEIVEEVEKLAEESPFIDLEAYKGQDDRQAKSLGTPGLFTPSHYILAHGKVTLDAIFCMCVNVITFYVYSHPVTKNSCGKALNFLPNFMFVDAFTLTVYISWCRGDLI